TSIVRRWLDTASMRAATQTLARRRVCCRHARPTKAGRARRGRAAGTAKGAYSSRIVIDLTLTWALGVGRLPQFPCLTFYSSDDSFSSLDSFFDLPALIVNFTVVASSS